MASYDASIRVSTRVDTDQLKEAQKEFDRLNKKLESLYAKGEKLEALGVDKQSKQWKSLRYDVAQTEVALGDASDRLKELNNLNSDNIGKGFQTASDAGKKFNSVIHTGTKKSNGLMKTLASRLKGITLSLLVFNWITKGFNAMVSAMKAGFQNLAKYSTDYNKSMSALKSECAQLKNGLAAAFEPVASVVIPYITQMVGWLNTAADTVARFLAALSGKSTYTKAKKQVIDYAKALDTASNSAKGALASFDSINVLTSNEATGGVETTGADAFETADVGTDMQAVIDTLMPFKDTIDAWLNNLNFEPIITAFDSLKTACAPIAGHITEGLKFFLDKVLLPIGSWTIEDLVPAFFNLLSSALCAFNVVWEIAQPYLAWFWDNFLAPAAAWVGDTVVDGINLITEALKGFSDWATANEENMDTVKAIILGLFAGIVTYYTAKGIVGMIGAINKAIAAFGTVSLLAGGKIFIMAAAIALLVSGILLVAQNWNKLNDLGKTLSILSAVTAALIAAAIAAAVFHTAWSVGVAAAAIIAGIAALGISSAIFSKWEATSSSTASMSDAASLYSSTSSSPLPALATGGITTRPTTALIGEAGKEAVLPLENNTEWMDVLADRIGQNVTIKFTGSLSELGRVLKPVIDTENARVGKSFRK